MHVRVHLEHAGFLQHESHAEFLQRESHAGCLSRTRINRAKCEIISARVARNFRELRKPKREFSGIKRNNINQRYGNFE